MFRFALPLCIIFAQHGMMAKTEFNFWSAWLNSQLFVSTRLFLAIWESRNDIVILTIIYQVTTIPIGSQSVYPEGIWRFLKIGHMVLSELVSPTLSPFSVQLPGFTRFYCSIYGATHFLSDEDSNVANGPISNIKIIPRKTYPQSILDLL